MEIEAQEIEKKGWMLPLFIVQFFTWLGFFALWIYSVPVFTKYIFKVTDSESKLYEDGVQWVAYSFAFYSLLASLIAFSIPKLLNYLSVGKLHSIALLIGGIGMISIYFVLQPMAVFIPFFLIGVAWSSIGNLPYKIIGDNSAEEKISRNMTLFNFAVVIPQITAAIFLNSITRRFFHGETIYTIILGGSCLILGSIICFLFVD
ncbi:MAG: hypothetical protein K1X72_25625 [Pyrinomonadaceae bacterium]|nr:hypothetical protein [Pyrinomonadaceae bacterium]